MKVEGLFTGIEETTWSSKDGSKSGKKVRGIFVSGNDRIKWETMHDIEWCTEHGVVGGAEGSATIAFSINNGWQNVTLIGFKVKENDKDTSHEPVAKSPEMVSTASAMIAKAAEENANDPEAEDKLPF